jgi:g-D-glutamyl-meso-diaminopimelate peptidase
MNMTSLVSAYLIVKDIGAGVVSMKFEHLQAYLQNWQTRYPWSVCEPIGVSVCGRPLHLFKVGSGKLQIHLNAAMHANEWLTAFVLARLGTRLCAIWNQRAEYPQQLWANWLQACSISFVPLVNPDGVRLVMDDARGLFAQWKANIRGVDLNDQFPAGWEREQTRRGHAVPGARDYGGQQPLSEPEARALFDYVKKEECAAVIAVHSQGKEIYYNYRAQEPAYAESIAQHMANESGYQAVKLTDSDAGFKDWFILHYRRLGLTLELGAGENPLPWRQFLQMSMDCERLLATCVHHLLASENQRR